MQEESNKYVKELTQEKYKYGFTTEVHTDIIEKGLNEEACLLHWLVKYWHGAVWCLVLSLTKIMR